MKCPKCKFEYEDSFKFCPNCSETNPLLKKEEPPQPSPPPQPPVQQPVLGITPPSEPTPVIPPTKPKKEKAPKKKLSEGTKPFFAKVKEKVNKKTIIIGAVILVVIIAAIVVPIVLTIEDPVFLDTD